MRCGAFGARARHYGQDDKRWQPPEVHYGQDEGLLWQPHPPACPPPPAIVPDSGSSSKRHRGGWFTKCQALCEAVLAGNLADARVLATMHYAGPNIDIAG